MIHNPRRSHQITIDGAQLWREGHGQLCTCSACLAWDASYGTDSQIAEAWKYSSERIVALQLLPSGNVVLYDYERRPFYIGDWFGVRAAYEARPKFERSERVEAKRAVAGIAIDDLIIDL